MICRMKLAKVISPRILIGLGITIAALLVFNVTRPPLQSELLTAFNTWYQLSAPALDSASDAALASRKLSVKVRLSGSSAVGTPNEWTLPAQNLGNTDDRARITRVLQLVHESEIFGIHPVASPVQGGSYLSILVLDGEHRFETTIDTQKVEQDIRIQNLIKLLEVFGTQPATPTTVPTSL
jgi:hypothetical protein